MEEDNVLNPPHYMMLGVETITIIAKSMTAEQWHGYCLGSAMKYRLRAGKKGSIEKASEDLAKAMFFEELYHIHITLTRDTD